MVGVMGAWAAGHECVEDPLLLKTPDSGGPYQAKSMQFAKIAA